MRKLLLSLAVPLVVIAFAVTAFAVVPSVLNTLAPGSTASPSTTSAPAWKVGDSWTYNLSFGSAGQDAVIPGEMVVQCHDNASRVFGTLTETVVGTVSTEEGDAFNVTENLTLLLGHGWSAGVNGMQDRPTRLANVSGFVWIRESDLAPLYARKSVHMVRTWNVSAPMGAWTLGHGVANGTYSLTYDAGTEVWFHPGLTALQFPLAENATYNVTSNATIHIWSSFQVSGPNVTFGSDHFVNFTVPIGFAVRIGQFENVTTPAGNFTSLPVSVYRSPLVPPVRDNDTEALTNLTLNVDTMTPHALATGWFSGDAGNFVQADLGLGGFRGPRIELTLVSYHLG
jgi:hypothetical protein